MSIWTRIGEAIAALAKGEGLSEVFEKLRASPDRSVAFTIAVIALGAKMAKADGSSIKEMNRLEKQDLLILDDFGIQPFDNQSRSSLMEIIEDRHGKRSTIITSQLPIKGWYEVIGEQTIADAILDRVVHNAHRIELKGESLRKKQITKEEEKE
mgnify:CR=1 FL=1